MFTPLTADTNIDAILKTTWNWWLFVNFKMLDLTILLCIARFIKSGTLKTVELWISDKIKVSFVFLASPLFTKNFSFIIADRINPETSALKQTFFKDRTGDILKSQSIGRQISLQTKQGTVKCRVNDKCDTLVVHYFTVEKIINSRGTGGLYHH